MLSLSPTPSSDREREREREREVASQSGRRWWTTDDVVLLRWDDDDVIGLSVKRTDAGSESRARPRRAALLATGTDDTPASAAALTLVVDRPPDRTGSPALELCCHLLSTRMHTDSNALFRAPSCYYYPANATLVCVLSDTKSTVTLLLFCLGTDI